MKLVFLIDLHIFYLLPRILTICELMSRGLTDRAKELLCGTQLKLYEIAEKTGYSDPKYFSKVFREATGLTPAEYRKNDQASR